jgi:hypothetical protein
MGHDQLTKIITPNKRADDRSGLLRKGENKRVKTYKKRFCDHKNLDLQISAGLEKHKILCWFQNFLKSLVKSHS